MKKEKEYLDRWANSKYKFEDQAKRNRKNNINQKLMYSATEDHDPVTRKLKVMRG